MKSDCSSSPSPMSSSSVSENEGSDTSIPTVTHSNACYQDTLAMAARNIRRGESVPVRLMQSNRQTVYGELLKNRKLLRDRILSFN